MPGANSVLGRSNRPSKGLGVSWPLVRPSCCLGSDGARADGMGELLELFITLPGLISGLGVGS